MIANKSLLKSFKPRLQSWSKKRKRKEKEMKTIRIITRTVNPIIKTMAKTEETKEVAIALRVERISLATNLTMKPILRTSDAH